MPIYDVDGVHYDIDTTDTEVAKSKIRDYLRQSDTTAMDKFTRPFKEGSWQDDSLLGPAIKYTAGSIAPDTFPGWKQEGQENFAKKGRAIAEGVGRFMDNPADTLKGVAQGIADNPAGFAGDVAKGIAYDPELLFVGPGGSAVRNTTARALERGGEGVVRAGQATADAGRAVAVAPGQALKGYDFAMHNRGTSAYKPVDPAVVELARKNKDITQRQADLINSRGTLLGEGQGVQGFAENLVSGYKNKPIQEMAFDVLPSLAMGAPIPGGAIKEATKAALDARLGGKVRGTASPDIVKTPEGYRGSSPAVQNPDITTPVATIDTATGSIKPVTEAEMRRRQFELENTAKLEAIRKQQILDEQARQADLIAKSQVRNATPEEIAARQQENFETHPQIQVIKQRAQAQLPSSPKDLAFDTLTGGSDPAATKMAAQNKAKQMLAPDMRAQIAARTAAREAKEKAEIEALLNEPLVNRAVPDQPGTNAPVVGGDKVSQLQAKLQQQPQAGQLFEGLPGEGTTGRPPSAAELKQLEMEAREAAGIEQPDMSDFGKVHSEAEIARLYERYKNAKDPKTKARLKAKYDQWENSRSDRGLNEGGVPGVLEMKTQYPSKDAFEQAKMIAELSNRPFEGSYINEAGNLVSESKIANDVTRGGAPESIQKRLGPVEPFTRQVRVESLNPKEQLKNRMDQLRKKHGDVMKMLQDGDVQGTGELSMEIIKAGKGNRIPGTDMTLAKVKKQMNIMSPGLEWEQVSPTHIRGRIGDMEYNVIDSNGAIYQTYRTIK
jgi:hypothetical protein